jgi:formylglycine-generating enzyme required for sulfatase activity
MKAKLRHFFIMLALLVLALGRNNGFSAVLTWNGSISTDWNNPTNWTPEQVPTNTDHVIINSGSVTIPADGSFAIMDWSGGVISGSLTVASNGVLNIDAASYVELEGALTNSGTIEWIGGIWYIINDGISYLGAVYNQPGGLVDEQGDLTMSLDNNNYPYGFMANAGTFRKSSGSGVTQIEAEFSNTGTVEADTGTISFQGGGAIGGIFNAESGASIGFASGNFTSAGAALNGPGTVEFIGDSLTLSNNVINGLQLQGGTVNLGPNFQGGTITNLTLAGSTLNGNYSVSGTLNWTGGVISGSLTVASNGVLNIDAASYVELEGALTNSGIIEWSGGIWYVINDGINYLGAVYNQPGGLVDEQGDLTMSLDNNNYPYGFMANAGTFRKSSGSGVTQIEAEFSNTGTVEADTGTISFQGGYSDGSSANLAISLGSATPGSGYGNISFSTLLSFNGTFMVSTRNGYQPSVGTSFQLLNYPSSTDSFTCLEGLDLGGGILLQPQFSPTGLTLLATAYTISDSQPKLFINPTLGGVAITWPVGFSDWTLQTTTNLSSPVWTTVPDACGNQAIMPTSAQRQYFRLAFNLPPGMALVPAGSFTMGDSLDSETDAIPTVSVSVSAFYMDTNLVSYSQWQSVHSYATSHGFSFANAGAGKAANNPVQSVDWYDCVKWCNARSQQAGLIPVYYTDVGLTQIYTNGETTNIFAKWAVSGFRLPTEAEWEKAARGGLIGQRFPWGNTISESHADYFGTNTFSYDLGPNGYNAAFTNGFTPYTSPVGYFAPNGFGLYDITGNVHEWCWDWYGTPYTGGSDPSGPGIGTNRVWRGGSWFNDASYARCAARNFSIPSRVASGIGFRCVRGH